ncbi:deoxyribose-phosphate aldolase [Cystoisospora suis]|uniref:Deoxyribose-phosphate aldolase n=1 Tax=Cystoisospora suis TaxID=483139 RepID=A0A2C6KHK0_9APIC|nr:deoxyribose-phosphate aldolase [Cystoisospora suis]
MECAPRLGMAHFHDPCRAYAARRVISLVDATDLADDSSTETVKCVCSLALDSPRAAAVCVWPRFVKYVKNELPLHLPGVATLPLATVLNFPGGKGALDSVKAEAAQAAADGADELDLVVDWELLNRDPEDGEQALRRLVAGVREVSGKKVLKVILETGMLRSDLPGLVQRASMAAMESGADFLKTSTGKVRVNATISAVQEMCIAIKRFNERQPPGSRQVGLKVAGGVKTLNAAAEYLIVVSDLLGPDFLRQQTFRIGASSLLLGAKNSLETVFRSDDLSPGRCGDNPPCLVHGSAEAASNTANRQSTGRATR